MSVDLLTAVLDDLAQILGILAGIQTRTANVAQESELESTYALLAQFYNEWTFFSAQLAGVPAQIAGVSQQVAALQSTLLAAIGTPQQAGQPVTLPPVPPPAYAPPTTAAISSDVWGFVDPDYPGTIRTLQLLEAAYNLANDLEQADFQVQPYQNNQWLIYTQWSEYQAAVAVASLPTYDLATILPSDATVVAWLQRIDPSGGFFDNGDGWASSVAYLAAGMGAIIYNLSPALFTVLRDAQHGASGAPVWPGIASVTLGTPQALVDGLLIPGPLDGVIIAITSVPVPISYYPFGPLKSYVHVGGIAFVDDSGEAETVQPIGLNANVVCPKSMVQADHAYIRLQSGVVGTVTPWVTA